MCVKIMLHKPHHRYWLVLLGFAVLFVVAWSIIRCFPSKPQGTVEVLSRQTVNVRGVPRNYRLVVPKSIKGSAKLPILFVYHGLGETPEQMAQDSRLNQLAAEKHCIVVYPQGRRLSWPVVVPENNPDYLDAELEFFDTLLKKLAADYPVDLKRVYALGMSQGGTFVSLLASKRSDRLAAIVSHSAWLPESLAKHGIHAQYKLPAMFIAGTDDKVVPQSQTRQAYECFKSEDHPAEFFLLPGVGHRWAWRQDINQRIWLFLSNHARKEPYR